MKKSLLPLLAVLFTLSLVSCNNDDDDSSSSTVEVADREEQAKIDDDVLKIFMDSYTYNDKDFEGNHELTDQDIKFYKLPLTSDELVEYNTTGTPLALSPKRIDHPVTYEYEEDVFITQTVYVIQVRKGDGEVPIYETNNIDTTYDMRIINTLVDNDTDIVDRTTLASESLDERSSKVWFSNYSLIEGVKQVSPLFRGGTRIEGSLNDCEVFYNGASGELLTNNDFGIGIVLLPSGVAYFNTSYYYDDEVEDVVVDDEVIEDLDNDDDDFEAYRKLVYTFSIYNTADLDIDGDGIPSAQEDLDDDGVLDGEDDDTDSDDIPNYLDIDDDGDGVLTILEVFIADKDVIDQYGVEKEEIDLTTATDSDCDGNYTNDNDVHFIYTDTNSANGVKYAVPGDELIGDDEIPYHLDPTIGYEE